MMKFALRIRAVVLLVLLFVVITIAILVVKYRLALPERGNGTRSPIVHYRLPRRLAIECPNWWLSVVDYKRCLLEYLSRFRFASSGDIGEWLNITGCLSSSSAKKRRVIELRNGYATKKLLVPSGNAQPPPSCTVVTIGIGGDIFGEQELKEEWPQCRFYGFDPIVSHGRVYKSIGRYWQMAVAHSNGTNAIRAKNTVGSLYYEAVHRVKTLSLQQAINLINHQLIDMLWIDANGFEYRLIEVFQEQGRGNASDASVCQVYAKLHMPFAKYGMRMGDFWLFLWRIYDIGPLIPLSISPIDNYPHYNMLLFNAGDFECVKKYFRNQCH